MEMQVKKETIKILVEFDIEYASDIARVSAIEAAIEPCLQTKSVGVSIKGGHYAMRPTGEAKEYKGAK